MYDYISIIENLIIIYRLYKKLAEGKKIVHRTNVQNEEGNDVERYCPLCEEPVCCNERCAWYNTSTACCEISRIADHLCDLDEYINVIADAIDGI